MARSVVERIVVDRSSRYVWPNAQLNLWNIIMLASAGTILGINAVFITQQERLGYRIPWIMPFSITVGALTIIVIFFELILIAQRRLVPGFVMLFAFILLVLWVTGLIETSIQLFGGGNISSNCNTWVNDQDIRGPSLDTLAWLEQNSICSSWYAVFAFYIIGCVFLVWVIVMASQVNRGFYERY